VTQRLTITPPPLVVQFDQKAAAQRAQMRAAERAGKRIAVRFEKPAKPWDKVRR